MTRLFTVDEANALLPELERRLHMLQRLYCEAKAGYVELKQLKAVGKKPDGTLIMDYDFRVARRRFERLVRRINRDVKGISGLGCQVKHVELGLIDFPARIGGERVLLCWRLGEPAVAYYHGEQDGYAGRRPVPGPVRR